jgi:hypothetical protein
MAVIYVICEGKIKIKKKKEIEEMNYDGEVMNILCK